MKPWSDERKKAQSEMWAKKKEEGYVRKGTSKYSDICCFNDNELLMFTTMQDAMTHFDLVKGTGITRVLRGERTFYKGYKWNALLKSGELMGTPEVDNHELSFDLNGH